MLLRVVDQELVTIGACKWHQLLAKEYKKN